MSDCRECTKCFDIEDGQQVWCRHSSGAINRVPWSDVVGVRPCGNFQPKPAPASPPVSADREGPDTLTAMRDAADALECLQEHAAHGAALQFDDGDVLVVDFCHEHMTALNRAISSEEVRRARPAVEDPRDALLRQCAADFARVRDYAPTLDRTPVDNSGCEDCARAREHAWPPSRLCETHYSKAAQQERANEQLLATQDYPMREIAREALEALRAAGVEPATAQEGKPSR